MFTLPGKKLLFMGGEFGQAREWNHDDELDWTLLARPLNAGMQRWVADLNALYRREPAAHAGDFSPHGFEWIDADDSRNSVLSFLRRSPDGRHLLVVMNLTPLPREAWRIGVPFGGYWTELLNSDGRVYGGGGMGNLGGAHATGVSWHGRPDSLALTLPPLAIVIFGATMPAPAPPQITGNADDSPAPPPADVKPAKSPRARRRGPPRSLP
jgi:1,4-alpha-glucan branching enzyme